VEGVVGGWQGSPIKRAEQLVSVSSILQYGLLILLVLRNVLSGTAVSILKSKPL